MPEDRERFPVAETPDGTGNGAEAAAARRADSSGGDRPPPDRPMPGRPLLPRWFARTVAYAGGLLVVSAAAGVLIWILLQVAMVAFAILVALLLTALLDPVARVLHKAVPAWAAALLSLLALLGAVGGTIFLLTEQVIGQIDDLTASLTASIDQIRIWLVNGPLGLAPPQVNQVHDQIVTAITSALPNGFTLASTVLSVAAGVVLALFLLFFLLKDGTGMWRWIVDTAPAPHRHRVDQAGRRAWATTRSYVLGVVIIALADAILIGAGLFGVGAPLVLSLTLLVFLGAFVPFLGALLSGAVAVLVTLVTNGLVSALIVLGVVLVVQNVEGNLLQPLVQGRQVHLHPVVIIVVVSVGYLLFGIPGAVIAVPIVAVAYRVASTLRHPDPDRDQTPEAGDGPDDRPSASVR